LFDYGDRVGQLRLLVTAGQDCLAVRTNLLQAGELALTVKFTFTLAQGQLRLDKLAHDVGEAAPLGVGQLSERVMLLWLKQNLRSLHSSGHSRSFCAKKLCY
jgi:hypothetical protein